MTNNLLQLKKDLKSFAKKCKGFKYTDSALFTFLLNGMLISAGELNAESKDSGISNQMNLINSSIGQMRKDFKHARSENNKLIKNTNLELTQLMEQGDHVTKSPWSNWQIGINDFYNDWHGTYKGRGDKSKENLNLVRKTDLLERFKASSVMSASYGTTSLDLVYEPPREVEVSAGIRPKEVNKKAPGFVPPEPSGALPPFDPKIIQPPKAPDAITVTPPNIIPPTLLGGGANPHADNYYYWDGNDGAISQVNVTSGTIDITGNTTGYSGGNMNLTLNNFHLSAYPGTSPNGTAPTSGTHNLSQRFFNTLLNVPYSEFGTGVTINYNYTKGSGGYEGAVVNLETEGVVNGNLASAVTNNHITQAKKDKLKKYQSYSGITGADNGVTELLFINKGTVNLLSENAIYLLQLTLMEVIVQTILIMREL